MTKRNSKSIENLIQKATTFYINGYEDSYPNEDHKSNYIKALKKVIFKYELKRPVDIQGLFDVKFDESDTVVLYLTIKNQEDEYKSFTDMSLLVDDVIFIFNNQFDKLNGYSSEEIETNCDYGFGPVDIEDAVNGFYCNHVDLNKINTGLLNEFLLHIRERYFVKNKNY